MQIELKDMITWGGILVGIAGQFFHLRGRITVLEMRQKDLRTDIKDVMDRIDHRLESIEGKLDRKADK